MSNRQQFVQVCACGCGQPTNIAEQSAKKRGTIKGQPSRFVVGHATRRSAEERFWEKVNALGCCWEWDGARKAAGYGNFAPIRTKTVLAHRWAWELLVGPIPDGMELDHRCKNPCCVCPDHLEVVTRQENLRRGHGAAVVNAQRTHCLHGHALLAENVRIDKRGARCCRACEQARRDRKRAALAEAPALAA